MGGRAGFIGGTVPGNRYVRFQRVLAVGGERNGHLSLVIYVQQHIAGCFLHHKMRGPVRGQCYIQRGLLPGAQILRFQRGGRGRAFEQDAAHHRGVPFIAVDGQRRAARGNGRSVECFGVGIIVKPGHRPAHDERGQYGHEQQPEKDFFQYAHDQSSCCGESPDKQTFRRPSKARRSTYRAWPLRKMALKPPAASNKISLAEILHGSMFSKLCAPAQGRVQRTRAAA